MALGFLSLPAHFTNTCLSFSILHCPKHVLALKIFVWVIFNESVIWGSLWYPPHTSLPSIITLTVFCFMKKVEIWLLNSYSCYYLWYYLFGNIAAVLDIILSWKARQSMSIYVKLRYILKAVTAAGWVVVLPVAYAYSWKNPPGFAQTIKSWFGNSPSSPSLFILAVLIYLSPNMLSTVLFLFPFILRFLEKSNNKIVMLLMWWSQVCRCMFLNFEVKVVFIAEKSFHGCLIYYHSVKYLYHLLFLFLSIFWYLAASTLCWKGNAWELNFAYQVREQSWIFWVSMAWIKLTNALTDYLLMALISRYTMFWVLLLVSKLAFSYYIEVFHLSIFRTLDLSVTAMPFFVVAVIVVVYCYFL